MPSTQPPGPSDQAPRAVAPGVSSLPLTLTSLVARDEERAAIGAQLRDPAVRLLTLTGPGGVGKTRLAIAAASDVLQDFPDGVAFINLSPISNPALVLDTISSALGIRDTGSESQYDRLLNMLSTKRMLLVLDNFEQVIAAGPQVRNLVGNCPGVTLLITSRTRLRVSGEHEFPVSPMPLGAPALLEHGQATGAVHLFIERARVTNPAFTLTAETLPAVAEIVARVDGLPLAIELAAARMKALSPAALLQRMEKRLPLLSGGARDLPLRQQTMRDTIGWSYDLLSPAEQAFFRRLTVFVGGFTLEAAEAIGVGHANAFGDAQEVTPYDVVDRIASLIDHSLLRQSLGSGDEPRFVMLETIREFGWEQVTTLGETVAAQSAHAAWCLDLAERAETALWGAEQRTWLDHLDHEKDNFRAAVHWALEQGEIPVAAKLGAALWPYWRRRGYMTEGRAQLARILAHPPQTAFLAEWSSLLTGAGILAAHQGDYDQAVQCSERALASWRTLGEQQGMARALLCLATVARFRDDYPRAEMLGQESLAAFRAINDHWGIGHVFTHLGMISWVQGNQAVGTACYQEALVHLRDIGDQPGIFEVVLEMGKGACDAGDLVQATKLLEECLALSTEMSDAPSRGAALTELGVVARLQRNYASAEDLFVEAAALAQGNGDRRQMAYLATHLGDIDLATGDIGRAAAHYAEALNLFLPMGNRVGIAHCLRSVARCARYGTDVAQAIRLFGSSSALFREIAIAPPLDRDPAADAQELAERLTPAEYAREWEAGWSCSMADAVAEALAVAADLTAASIRVTPRELALSPAVRSPPQRCSAPAQDVGLTPREIEVLRLLAEGLSDREIAGTLSLSPRTVGWHVNHLLTKLDVSGRTAAAAAAIRHGLI